MSLFNPDSGKGKSIELIPKGTLAWVGIHFREMKQSKEKGGLYADLELTVADGPYLGRKIWEMICDPYDTRNSQAWRDMAVANLTRLFEAAEIFLPSQPDSYNKFNERPFTEICAALDGQVAAVQIKVEVGQDGHADKNKVAQWLSPNPNSGGHKQFLLLINPQAVAETNRTGFLSTAKSTTGVATPQAQGGFQPPVTQVSQPVETAAPVEAAPVQQQEAPAAPAAAAPAFQRPGAATGGTGAGSLAGPKPAWVK